MALSLDDFLTRLNQSGLLTSAEVQDILDQWPADRPRPDTQAFAQELVRQKRLTKFQAEQIHAGKGKSLTLGNYLILDKLGQGGMGMVLKAKHTRMGRLVALKVMSPAALKSPDAVKRFHREVQAAAKLEHPNIVTAYDADEANGTHFLVMQFIDGNDLSELVKKHGPLPVEQAVRCILQAARGLEFAHEQGVIHRDIKPANLLIDAKGTVKILDMGLARIEGAIGGSSEAAGLTNTGAIMGTVDYMPPEQAMDAKHADARSDIYSLGISLYYLLTGHVAYGGDTMMKKLMAHREMPIPSLLSLGQVSNLPGQPSLSGQVENLPHEAATPALSALNQVFQRMVAKKPEDRFQTMTEVIAGLDRCLAGAPTVAIDSTASGSASGNELQQFLRQISTGESSTTNSVPPTIAKGTATAPSERDAETITTATSESGADPQSEATMVLGQSGLSRSSTTTISAVSAKSRNVLVIAVTSVVVLLLGIAFALRGPSGALHLAIKDELIEVTLGETGRVVKGVTEQDLSLPVGEHVLHIQREELAFDTDPIELKKGEPVTITVERVGRRVRAMQGSTLLGHKESPKLKDPATVSPASPDFALEFTFGAENPRVEIPLESLDPNQPWTLEGFIHPADVPDHNHGLPAVLSGHAWQINLNHWTMRLTEQSAPVGQNPIENVLATSSAESLRGKRFHVAAVYGDKLAQLFINGKLVGGAPSKFLPKQNLGKLILGARFMGTMDEWRISKVDRYGKNFTPPQRYETDADTLALYHFDEGTGDVLRDSSGNNHHGQIRGAKWVRADGATVGVPATGPVASGTPFVTLRSGAAAARHATLEEALDASQPQDVIEVHGNGPFPIGGPKAVVFGKREFTLTLKGAAGFRPLFVSARSAADNTLSLFDFHFGAARFEDIDFVSAGSALFEFYGVRDVAFLRCRCVATSNSPGVLMTFHCATDQRVSFSDCLVASARREGGLRFLGAPARVEMTNTFAFSPHTPLNLDESAHAVKLNRCTLIGGSATIWNTPKTKSDASARGLSELSRCLVLGPSRIGDHVRWQGKENVYALSQSGYSGIILPGNVNQTFDEWVNSPAKPETGSKLLPTKAKSLVEFLDPDPAVMFRKLKTYLAELHNLHPDVGADPAVPDSGLKPTTPNTPPDKTQSRVIDLLPVVEVSRDAGVGNWKRVTDGVACENPAGANVLQLPYEPPEEYDFEIEFTTTGNGLNVNQYVAASGQMFAWKLNSHNVSPPLYGFELLDGKFAKDNKEAATQIPESIKDGQRYRSTVEVRRGSLRTLLDGKELVKWTGDFKRLSLETATPMKHPGRIGIGSWRRPVTFHSVTVREVSGAGKLFAAAPAQPINDLISKIDVAREGSVGSWKIEQGTLTTIAGPSEGNRRLYLPIDNPPVEYDLRLKVQRASARDNALMLGLVSGGHRVGVVLDGFKSRGGLWGLELIGGKGPLDNGTSAPNEPLKVDVPAEVLVQVRKTGIRIERDGKQLIHWTGSAEQLSLSPIWDDKGPPRFFLGAQGDFVIQRLTFDALAGGQVNSDRRAAEWVIAHGGEVTLSSKQGWVANANDLPEGDLEVRLIKFKRPLPGENADLIPLRELKHLEFVGIDYTQPTPAGITALARLPKLERVSCGGQSLSEEQVTALGRLNNVTSLFLAGAKLTPAHCAILAKSMPQVRSFNLMNNPLLDDTALTPLIEMRNLKVLQLQGTKVTAAGVATLQQALPNCSVEWDGAKK